MARTPSRERMHHHQLKGSGMRLKDHSNIYYSLQLLLTALLVSAAAASGQDDQKVKFSGRTVVAEVVALDQSFMVNRLGSSVPTGQIFALRTDVMVTDSRGDLPSFTPGVELNSYVGKVMLKEYKRPRPIVLRANVGDILEIRFCNLLSGNQYAGFHIMGLNLLSGLDENPGSQDPPPLSSDSSYVGKNANSFADNKGTIRVYRYFAASEGTFIIYSAAQPNQTLEIRKGLFGCASVQPPQAEYYRSEVTRSDLFYSTYRSTRLPPNMLLHKEPDAPGHHNHWILTTYKSRFQKEPIKNVDVVIEQNWNKLFIPLEERKPTIFYKRVSPTTNFEPQLSAQGLEQEMVAGNAVPDGYLYSADTGHPIIDYSAFYDQGDLDKSGNTRPVGSPILRMLFPVAKKLLVAQKDSDSTLLIKKGAKFFELQGENEEKAKAIYETDITELDNGALPRSLTPILDAWGIVEVPGLTQVAPERSYLSEVENIEPGENFHYIWLLTGVKVGEEENVSVVIQGEIPKNGPPRLTFLKAELQLLHSDPTAIITGPQVGRFRYSQDSPSFYEVPALPDRRQPYREFVLAYHNPSVQQAFPPQQASLQSVLGYGADNFAINYGIAAIATEILANRLGVGPEGINGDETDLKFEEFFLSSWAVGDPAMLVDRPANTPKPGGTPGKDPPDKGRATKVVYADDPSNVYHSYIRDHVVMRIYNAGVGPPHVHHLHAHQWLRSPNSDSSQYLDSELIIPGSAFSLDMVYNGSGNRNQTVGDSIFHCHFYPHFAKGMWALWRVHDVFEEGTLLDPGTGAVEVSQPGSFNLKLAWVRALPDGEIQTGTPIPAIVPLPTVGMAPIPSNVRMAAIPPITDPPGANWGELKKWVNVKDSQGRMVQVEPVYERDGSGEIKTDTDGKKLILKDKDGLPVYDNPGFPFFVPGVAGHRPPHPPLAMAWEEKTPGVPDLNEDGQKKYLNGGLPRHQVLGGEIVREFHTRWDFTKDFIRYKDDDHRHQTAENAADGALVAYLLPEDGTPIEKGAMKAHATRTHTTVQPDGSAGSFILNGLPPINGAPFADPGVDDNGNSARDLRSYKAAAIQKDVVINKLGWHYPQERFITLWQDVKPTFCEKRPPQPFFFRANGGETVDFWHTNLVPDYYELDDFQVRTPTDIIGQHIHLVKFDVTSSDGAENGFNYEDGVFSPDEVRARIFAITRPWAEGSYKKLPEKEQSARKYDLFAFNDAAGGVAGIKWSEWARSEPLKPVPWDYSFLQWQMTQGQPKPDPRKPLPPNKYLEPPDGQNWDGAMTSIMRFSTDPLLNNEGQDRTVRTVFTHDHFGASTHQQAGLYGGLLVEPANSNWIDPVTGRPYYDSVTRSDGGPTGWEAIIQMPNRTESYREFALELQDLQLAYGNQSRAKAGPIWDSKQEKNPSGNPELFSLEKPPSDGKIMPQKDLYANFLNNGITLSDTAEVKAINDQQWAVKDKVKYAYGPTGDEAAFYIVKTVAKEGNTEVTKYKVFTPNLNTWIDGLNAIGGPGAEQNKDGTIKKAGNPQLVSQGGGTYSFNYRNEPLTNSTIAVPPENQGRVAGKEKDAADFAYSFASIKRDPPWNNDEAKASPVTGATPPPLFNRPIDPANVNGAWDDPVHFTDGGNDVNQGKISSYDPYTPLLRAYQNDRVQIRVLAGAHTAPHSFTAHGVKWLFEPSSTNSGYRNAQGLGISEHFELIFRLPPATTPHEGPDMKGAYSFADYLYVPSSDTAGLPLGMWGVMRSYDPGDRSDNLIEPPIKSLHRLPEAANPRPYAEKKPICFKYPAIPDVAFTITAQPTPIVYNNGQYNDAGPIQNPAGVVFSVDRVQAKKKGDKPQDDQLEEVKGAKTNPGDPLVLRVNAGNWVKVTLRNKVPTSSPISSTIGLHPQLLAYDINTSDGANIGFNAVQTVSGVSGGADQRDYWWYAGDLQADAWGNLKTDECTKVPLGLPRELGAVNLLPPDPLNQHKYGLVGALVVEPAHATWDTYVGASATIKGPDEKLLFKELVLIQQNDVTASYLPQSSPSPSPTPSPKSVNFVLNNKSEDLGYRLGATASPTYSLFSNALAARDRDPKTPVFEVNAGDQVRFRVLLPGGSNANPVFEIHGHSWQEEPYVNDSLKLGDNVKSQVLGAQIMLPNQALNIVIDSAGGPGRIPGDYLFYDYLQTTDGRSGAWGILRVKPASGNR
jgi:hypothetical protein